MKCVVNFHVSAPFRNNRVANIVILYISNDSLLPLNNIILYYGATLPYSLPVNFSCCKGLIVLALVCGFWFQTLKLKQMGSIKLLSTPQSTSYIIRLTAFKGPTLYTLQPIISF
jgi:hypothetical protein|uniref:Uncharacterized protein n=1 Tax=Zea mays TaxID=4577 RepID=A0A804NX64_MAIZE